VERLIVIVTIIGFTLTGFAVRLFEYKQITKRIQKTHTYRDRFVDFLNELISNRSFDDQNYIWLTENVNEMQAELGSDGIVAHMSDPLLLMVTVQRLFAY
jgi:hypothetical protein